MANQAKKKAVAPKKKVTAPKKKAVAPAKKTGAPAKKNKPPRKAVAAPVKASVKKPDAAPAAKTYRLTQHMLDEFRTMLMAMRNRLTGQIASLKDDSLQRQDAVNSEEDGTDAFERQFALNIASTENDVVFEIDEALQRMAQGGYGTCEQCKCMVELPRLRALPFVRMCIRCKTETEKGTPKFRPLAEMERI